jgi:hypothetical protein
MKSEILEYAIELEERATRNGQQAARHLENGHHAQVAQAEERSEMLINIAARLRLIAR